jgi:uncharacterized repeat protein (TIGR03843 family)
VPPAAADASPLQVLRSGDLRLLGRLPGSTNNALLGEIGELPVVYKPTAGERPLFDFPEGTLARREVAAFLVSDAAGLRIVPPTVLRDGPFGEGMVQLWVDGDPGVDLVELVVSEDPRLRSMALFDAVVNNTDRKGGHLVPMADGHIYGVDHGVTFSTVWKLRTVLWAWQGRKINRAERAMLGRIRAALDGDLAVRLHELLAPIEVAATIRRVDRLLDAGRFPDPNPDWPAIPWPPF